MSLSAEDRDLAINPLVPDSIAHNTRVCFSSPPLPPRGGGGPPSMRSSPLPLFPQTFSDPPTHLNFAQILSTLRSLTASLFGIASGILGLESWRGFLFYFLGSLVVSALIYVLKARGNPSGAEMYFQSPLRELWAGEIMGGLSSFVLTWTLFYGLVGG